MDLQYRLAKDHSVLLRVADFEAADPQFNSEERVFLMYSYGM